MILQVTKGDDNVLQVITKIIERIDKFPFLRSSSSSVLLN